MPIYEYKCHRCGKHFDVRQKFSDEPLRVHKGCGGEVERLISVPTLQFKGTGWYVTDYARNGRSPSTAGPNGHSHEASESKSESGTETKTVSKAETAESKPAAAKP